jgi:hypothetical protein
MALCLTRTKGGPFPSLRPTNIENGGSRNTGDSVITSTGIEEHGNVRGTRLAIVDRGTPGGQLSKVVCGAGLHFKAQPLS